MKFIITLGLILSFNAFAVDLNQVEKDLKGNGVAGWIHGSVESQGLYVFTYRNPNDFFDYVEMSLVTFDPVMMKKLSTFNRHDKILIKGSFLANPSPQKHINLTSAEMVQKYDSGMAVDPYQHEAKIPDDLIKMNSATFLVHALAGDGHILVVEYKDTIVPVYVTNNALTKNLFRNDLVQLSYKIQPRPHEPVHLNLDESNPNAVKVLESIQALHGKPAVVEGSLIMFPKSPEIMFNVFAVEQTLTAGLKRQYTIVNFDDPVVFSQIRAALQKAWDHHSGEYVNGRNKLISNHIRVKVTGTFNEVDANQANPQVLIKSLGDLQIFE